MNKATLYLIVFLTFFLFTGSAVGDDLALTGCTGVTEKEDGTITFPSPLKANAECYPKSMVNDSRLASLFAFRALIRDFGLDVTMSAMPIKWQVEAGGPERPAWEVYIYANETGKVMMLYLVTADTGYVKKICDNRFEDQHCRNTPSG